jgi:uncharacterized protein YceH (UPF0502 family)
MAIICELLVRGPQTPGDLRAHCSRLHTLTDSSEVELILEQLKSNDEGTFVVQLPRQPGKRERRWAHLFGGEPDIGEDEVEEIGTPDIQTGPTRIERIQTLEYEVADLKQEISELKAAFEAFKTAFE